MRTALVRRGIRLAIIAVGIALPAAAQAQDHLYNLNGSLADVFGGPSLVANGGTLGPTGYTFAADQGLSLSNVLGSVYTIVLRSSLDDGTGYRKMIDFKNRTSDNGYYNKDNQANYYLAGDIRITSTTPYTTGDLATTVLTRNAAGTVAAYVDGALEWSFSDPSGDATFDTPTTQIARFFEDDNVTGQGEASSGFVDYIATYNTALTEDQVRTLSIDQTPVLGTPEPASLALVGTGLIGIAGFSKRRNRAKATPQV